MHNAMEKCAEPAQRVQQFFSLKLWRVKKTWTIFHESVWQAGEEQGGKGLKNMH